MKKYAGKNGLQRAIEDLLEFERENERLSNTRDKELFGIRSTVYRREWQSFGINSWRKLMQRTFGKERIKAEKAKKNIYCGK